MNNLVLRAITGLLFVGSILCSVWFSPLAATLVFSSFFVLGTIEYSNLFKHQANIQFNRAGFIAIALLAFGLLVFALEKPKYELLLFLEIPLVFCFLLMELWRKKLNPILNISVGILGLFYMIIPFGLMLMLNQLSDHMNIYLIGMFLLVWTNDTFAYLSGRIFGKTKLIERISPNKTWEGTIGGIIFTLGVGFLLGLRNGSSELGFWIISAAIIAPTAILGDLIESMFKRNLNIKDSGNILPGHGGILDRFDAALFTVPFFFGWLMVYSKFLLH